MEDLQWQARPGAARPAERTAPSTRPDQGQPEQCGCVDLPAAQDAGQESQRKPEQRQEGGQLFERVWAGLIRGLHGYLPLGSIVQAGAGMDKGGDKEKRAGNQVIR